MELDGCCWSLVAIVGTVGVLLLVNYNLVENCRLWKLGCCTVGGNSGLCVAVAGVGKYREVLL